MSDATTSGKRPRDEERVGNLGWLASSGALPRKKQDIEGVSGSSILELQAQLYRAQENAKLRSSGVELPDRRTSGLNVAALMKGRNAGVEERDKKDRLEVKSTADRIGECYAALERKAQLYEKLARGEVEDDEDQYEVDFLRKGEEGPSGRSRSDGPLDSMLEAVSGSGGMLSADMQRERDRRAWEREQDQALADEEAEARRRKQKEELLSLGQQTREERQRAEALKTRKEEAERLRREELKHKFLREQLAKKLGAGGKGGTAVTNKNK
ncbi:hypothetical protein VOLCADRAFT_88415 [Volvox carteri f. nagariensis]|uniref:Uncharacterized protein n=1 Tax=Volvox carteri f. nagariensis TaxID=3068 RepID=D8TNA4_VOLCA|nr:uncharacterized protein VOLCADRAFT_88415 [Volvox carteri f. nagariensis]EFJ51105.1 hypothetical protein VOLCADRAFT_88415 [Volvox carteri f. nagariensis]|eukprot:XP_002948117.1 hypothetical protein VOLCADRAFT_88415 [Volvox carteri f. nagariensis]